VEGAMTASIGAAFVVASADICWTGAAGAGLWTVSAGGGFGVGCVEEAELEDFGSQVSPSSSSVTHGGVGICGVSCFLIMINPNDVAFTGC
jgi:hypothetical protein